MKQLVRTALYASKSERFGRFFRLAAHFSRAPLKRLGVYGIWGAIWLAVFTVGMQIGYAVDQRANDTDAGAVAGFLSIGVMTAGVFILQKFMEKAISVWHLSAENDVKEE